MQTPHEASIRNYLRTQSSGVTVKELHAKFPWISKKATIRKILERMPDAYIDRWTSPVRGQYQAVWCVLIKPQHCPYPTDRYKPETRWMWQQTGELRT